MKHLSPVAWVALGMLGLFLMIRLSAAVGMVYVLVGIICVALFYFWYQVWLRFIYPLWFTWRSLQEFRRQAADFHKRKSSHEGGLHEDVIQICPNCGYQKPKDGPCRACRTR